VVEKNTNLVELSSAISGDFKILGALDRHNLTPSPIDHSTKNSISFCSKTTKDALQIIRGSKAKVIICSNKLKFVEDDYKNKTLILVSNPKLVFAQVLRKYFEQKAEFGISPTAVIDKNARIHPRVYIGPHCYIGRCQIGEETIIYGNVHIYSNVKIGKRVIIHAGTVIGADGMEYVRNGKGEFVRFPHISGVIIEDDVHIGSNASIMRGVLRNTVIGQGTRLGPFCSIGHQTIIGKHCLIITRSLIGGSASIGNHSRISMGAIIRDGIEIGSNVTIGMGSIVTKSIGDGWTAFGVPAREVRRSE